MKITPYLKHVVLALVVNLLIFVTLIVGDARSAFLVHCVDCQSWPGYAIAHIFETSRQLLKPLFLSGTPFIAVVIAFRSALTRKVLLATLVLVLMYVLGHAWSGWSDAYDGYGDEPYGDETGAVVYFVLIAIGIFSIPISTISTVSSLAKRGRESV
jgi:hypothetical protein